MIQELPENPSKILENAVLALNKEKYRKSKLLAFIELKKNPNNYFGLCCYANSLYYLGGKDNNKIASQCYIKAIKLKPNHPLAHLGLGRLHYTNVMRIHNEYNIFPGGSNMMFLDELAPDNYFEEKHSITIKGFADEECGNRELAIMELEKAAFFIIEKEIKVELLNMIADLKCTINNEEGINAYKEIIRIDSKNIQARFNIAGCYIATGKKKKAIEEYEFIKIEAPDLIDKLKKVFLEFGLEIEE
jgi:tetratricopeptide (TPR) repeat protein